MDYSLQETLIGWAHKYNDPQYFHEDPIIFPRHFAQQLKDSRTSITDLQKQTGGMSATTDLQKRRACGTILVDGASGMVLPDGASGTVLADGASGTVLADGASGTVLADGACGTVLADGASGTVLADVEIAAVLAAHLAWGRRAMIVRDCERMFDQMQWRPYDYVMAGDYRDDDVSLHRTIKWSEFAAICHRLRRIYSERDSLEGMTVSEMRCHVFGQKDDPRAANKKINMMRRWLVRDDGKVDLGVWKNSDRRELILPLDVHVYNQAKALGLTSRKQKDLATAQEITDIFRAIFPDDPCLGDFALFGYGVTLKATEND